MYKNMQKYFYMWLIYMHKQVSIDMRNKIITLYELNWTMLKIASYLGINSKTCSLWISKYIKNKTLNNEKKSGRPRKTTKEEDIIIVNKIVKNKEILTSDDIVNELKNDNIIISKNTVIHRLKEISLIYANTVKKPMMTENHKQLRLKWAIEHYNFDWTQVKFSDETIIRKKFNTKQWMFKDNKKIERSVKHPISVLLWGCIHFGGVGELCCFNGIMNTDKYTDILSKHLLPYNTNSYYFQFDNDPKHKSINAFIGGHQIAQILIL